MGCVPSKHRPPAGVSGDDLPNPESHDHVSDQNQTQLTNPVEADGVVAGQEQQQQKQKKKKLRVFIVFYSMYGHVELMAREIKKGVDSTEGVEGVLYRVPETLSSEVLEQMKVPNKDDGENGVPVLVPERLVEADGVLFGFPTRYGSMAAQMKAFFDSTGELWREQKLAGVPAGFFVSTGTQGGGQETTAMKSGPKDGWQSIMPLCLRGKSASRFCMFPNVKTQDYSPGNVPVYLNVYDLTPANGYVYWAGVGIFHSGVEVYGVEYAFGAHECSSSGVFEVEPRQCPGFKFRRSIFIGTTCLDPFQVREFMERQSANYNGDTYHLIVKNCNHFCHDICYKLTGKSTPKWVNRLAKIGLMCNCILPNALKSTTVPHDPNFQEYESEKKRLRSSFTCLSSISMPQREVSMSSLFLHSHYKGCLPPWELKRSRNGSLKKW